MLHEAKRPQNVSVHTALQPSGSGSRQQLTERHITFPVGQTAPKVGSKRKASAPRRVQRPAAQVCCMHVSYVQLRTVNCIEAYCECFRLEAGRDLWLSTDEISLDASSPMQGGVTEPVLHAQPSANAMTGRRVCEGCLLLQPHQQFDADAHNPGSMQRLCSKCASRCPAGIASDLQQHNPSDGPSAVAQQEQDQLVQPALPATSTDAEAHAQPPASSAAVLAGLAPPPPETRDVSGKLSAKTCTTCSRLRPVQDFWGSRHTADGYQARCRACLLKAKAKAAAVLRRSPSGGPTTRGARTANEQLKPAVAVRKKQPAEVQAKCTPGDGRAAAADAGKPATGEGQQQQGGEHVGSGPGKQCRRCQEWKAVAEFGPHCRQRDGLQPWCRPCLAVYFRARVAGQAATNKPATYKRRAVGKGAAAAEMQVCWGCHS